MAYSEFVIWGTCPKQGPHSLLLVNPGGKPITSREAAQRYQVQLAAHGCSDFRIQEIPFHDSAAIDLAATWQGGAAQ